MTLDMRDAWTLPAAERFVTAVEDALEGRIAIVEHDAMAPSGIAGALERAISGDFYRTVEPIVALPGIAPAKTVSEPFGAAPSVRALRGSALDQSLALVDLSGLDPPGTRAWQTFAERFGDADEGEATGLAIILVNAPPGFAEAHRVAAWGAHLRRIDLTIWADRHVPPAASPLVASMAVALAVEMCGWRLDLGKQMACASLADLADPLNWLETRDVVSLPDRTVRIGGATLACPLHLLDDDRSELRRRVWRAQLITLYPWLEDQRQDVIARHGKMLRIDDHLRTLGVNDIEEIEIGALAYQLDRRVDPATQDRLTMLRRIRNLLAHRRPADPADVQTALQEQ